MTTLKRASLISQLGSNITKQNRRYANQIIAKKITKYSLADIYKNNDSYNTLKTQRSRSTIKGQIQTSQPSSIMKLKNQKQHSKENSFFPKIQNIKSLIMKQKQFYHVLREKLDNDMSDCVYFFLQIFCFASQYQIQLCKDQIVLQKSILIQTIYLVASSFLQMGVKNLSLFFACFGVQVSQAYKQFYQIGRFLFIIAKIFRKIFKYNQSIILLKKALQYIWTDRKASDSGDLQLEIYNQLSYGFLQLSFKQESRIFAQKYEIGYLEKQDSKIISLSNELINSAQKRTISWSRVTNDHFQILFSLNLHQYLIDNQINMKQKFKQLKFMKDCKINIDKTLQSFLKKQLFFYQIPLPLQLKKNKFKTNQKGSTLPKIRSRTINIGDVRPRKTIQDVAQNRIFNYRGIGISRSKLSFLLKNYIDYLKLNTL